MNLAHTGVFVRVVTAGGKSYLMHADSVHVVVLIIRWGAGLSVPFELSKVLESRSYLVY